jgi:hypothetical protein
MPTVWPAKTVLKLIFLWPRQMRPQFVTTMILQSLVGTRRMLMDLSQKFNVQGFMGTFVVEDLGRKFAAAGFAKGAQHRLNDQVLWCP